jgi:hypothetical protein
MVLNCDQATHFEFLQASLLAFLLLLIPIVLSNHPQGAALGILVLVVVFCFPGYLLLTLLSRLPGSFRTVLSPISAL